ncbi:MAG: hypothetical protein QOG72_1161 [Sphingomonadales bacterium]|jgi:hypothetical protein|nr:hypothetical protein [Sphingomonadales bacterium]
MTATAAHASLKYRLRSPGDGVYRVRLIEASGDASAEAFFAGDFDEQTVELPPGEYWAIVSDVSTGATGRRIPIRLADAGELVTLPYAPGSARGPGQGPLAPSPVAERAIDRRSSTIHREAEPRRAGRFLSPPSLWATSLFDIRISEDHAPGSVGGWRAPEGLHIDLLKDQGSSLELRIRDDREQRKSRVRMSIGIEGLPTIRVPLPLYRDGIVVKLHPAHGAESGGDLLVEVTAANPKLQALVTALSDLSSDEALSVLNWAAEGTENSAIAFLAEKVRDLWAASAAAVLLVKCGRIAGVTSWLHNLARLAPHIADASITAAWASVAEGEGANIAEVERRAMDYLARAGRIGAPNYTVANSLNLELLSSLHATALDRKVRDRAAKEYRRATERSRFRLFKSPYMIWEEAGERLQGGRLAGDHYLELASGELRPDDFRIA